MSVEDRIGAVETDLKWVKTAIDRSQVILDKLAESMHELTTLQIRQQEDRKALDRMLENQEKMNERITKAFDAIDAVKASIVKEQNEERGKTLHKLSTLFLTVVSTLGIAWIAQRMGLSVK